MVKRVSAAGAAAWMLWLLAAPPAAAGDGLREAVAADYEGHLEELFVHFHRNPELSFRETATAARIAEELRAAGVEVTEGVGGTGVVGMIRNGDGPTVLVRADMDGLPLQEASGLPYASTATQVDITGLEQPVMHACGHDVHVTALVGTARRLMAMKDRWSGTVMLIAQPEVPRDGMGAEDFAYFVQTEDRVPGAYFSVGGTAQADLDAEAAGGPAVPGHHSPLFRIEPEPSVTTGVEAMTVAVLELLGKP